MSQKSNKTLKPIRPSTFDIKNLSFEPFIENERASSQYISFPRYNNGGFKSNLVFITDWLHLEQYGIPHGEFVKKDEDKEKIRVPLNLNGETPNEDLIRMFKQIDELVFDSIPNIVPSKMKKFFQKKDKKDVLIYNGIYREPQATHVDLDDDDDEDSDDAKKKKKSKKQEPKKEPKEKLPYFTVKFEKDYNTGNITTVLYVTKPDPNDATVDGKPDRENLKTIGEIEKIITWNCKIRMVVQMTKLWINKLMDKDAGKYKCGATLKVKQIEVKPTEKMVSIKDAFSAYAFGENDDAETTEPVKNNGQTNNNSDENGENANNGNNSDNPDEENKDSIEEESDSSDEEEKTPKKKAIINKKK